MLLIDDGQPQLGKDHGRLNQGMRAHQDVDVSCLEVFENRLARRALDRPRQQLHPNVHGAQHLSQAFEVLLGQDFRRGHDGRLVAIVLCQQCGEQRHHRLAAPHVPLKQAVHVPSRVEVASDFTKHALLSIGQLKRQPFVVKRVERVTHFLKPNTGQVLRDGLFVLQQSQLEQKQLLEPKSGLGLFRFDRSGGLMHLAQRLSASHQLHLAQHPFWQGLRQRRCDLGRNVADELRQALAVQTMPAQLLGARVHRMQSIPFARFVMRKQLHFRVGDVPLAFVEVGLAVDHHFLLNR